MSEAEGIHNIGSKASRKIAVAFATIVLGGLLIVPSGAMSLVSENSADGEVPVHVGTSGNFRCILSSYGNVRCEGNDYGGETEDYMGGDAIQLSVGYMHKCIVTEARNVLCSGPYAEDYFGGDAIQVSAGYFFTCALVDGGDVSCWGFDDFGQAEGYDGGDAVQVSTGTQHACAVLESGDVTCWGRNMWGESEGYGGGDAIKVALGDGYTCALISVAGLTSTGQVQCWGKNQYGESNGYLGTDAVDVVTHPFGDRSCAVTLSGSLLCWGRSSSDVYAGIGDDRAQQASITTYSTCVLTERHEVNCW